jgi:hypothetical protein
MPTEFIKDKEISDAVTDMLANLEYSEFAPIRDHEVKIEACLCVRTNQDGEDMPPKPEPVALKRVPPLERLYVDADYILVVDNSAWKTANTDQAQLAILHRGLMKINIENTDGKIKIGTRKPDVVEFSATLVRFGPYTESLLNLREIFSTAGKKFAVGVRS